MVEGFGGLGLRTRRRMVTTISAEIMEALIGARRDFLSAGLVAAGEAS
jgi:hypothetical protein